MKAARTAARSPGEHGKTPREISTDHHAMAKKMARTDLSPKGWACQHPQSITSTESINHHLPRQNIWEAHCFKYSEILDLALTFFFLNIIFTVL